MTLRQIFIHNLRIIRKKEGITQMQLAEYCETATSYIGEIEIGRRFPSMELIEKIAAILKTEPYHFFMEPKDNEPDTAAESLFPRLPNTMKKQMNTQIKTRIDHVTGEMLNEIREIIDKY